MHPYGPDIASYSGAVLGPQLVPPHAEGLVCEADIPVQHLRSHLPGGIVNVLEVRQPTGRPVEHVAGDAIYGGPWFDHFGHMAAEGMHRLWAAKLITDLVSAPIVFQGRSHDSVVRHWFDEMLDCWGLSRDRVKLTTAPTWHERLHVPRQARLLGGDVPLPQYAARYPFVAVSRGCGSRWYVSRSRYIHTGSYLGESLIERLLADVGFGIMHPQELAMSDVIARFASADMLVFAEGSAIHHLDLLGPTAAKVFVIGRRAGAARRFSNVLATLVPTHFIFESNARSVSLGWQAENVPHKRLACSFIDVDGVVAALAHFTGERLRRPTTAEVRHAQAFDLLRYVMDQNTWAEAGEASLGRALLALRRRSVIRELLDEAAGQEG